MEKEIKLSDALEVYFSDLVKKVKDQELLVAGLRGALRICAKRLIEYACDDDLSQGEGGGVYTNPQEHIKLQIELAKKYIDLEDK